MFLSAIPAVLAAVSVSWGWEVLGGLRGGFGGWLLPDAAREGVAENRPVGFLQSGPEII